jgi:hypothetical protein
MKRYLAIPLLGGLSAVAFVGGYYLCLGNVLARGLPLSPVRLLAADPAGIPITLTINTPDGSRQVSARYSSFTFNSATPGSIAIEYASDRIFCSSFQPSNCYGEWP